MDYPNSPNRVLSQTLLLKLLAELLASYVPAATILLEERFQNHSIVYLIIEKFLLSIVVGSPDVVLAAKAVLTNLINNPISTKANENLVNEIKNLLCSSLNVEKKEGDAKQMEVTEKISILARLIMLLRECSQVFFNSLYIF